MKKRIIFISSLILTIVFVVFLFKYKINDKAFDEYKTLLKDKNLPVKEQVKIANSYLNDSKEGGLEIDIINANIILGDIFQSQYDYKRALELYLESYRRSLKSDYSDMIPEISYKIACIYLEMGEYIQAYDFAIKSYSLEKKKKKSQLIAEVLNLLGNIYEKTGLYIKSLATHYESLEIQKENENQKGIANSYHNLAHIHMLAGRYDNAFTYYLKALDIYQKFRKSQPDSIDIKMNIAKIQISIGNYFISQNDSLNAFKNYYLALEMSKKANIKMYIAQSLFSIGNVYYKLGDFSKAEEYYLNSLEINQKENHKIGITVAHLNLGKIYYHNNQLPKAINAFNKSYMIASEISAGNQMAEISELLYIIYSNLPDSIEQAKKFGALYLKSKNFYPSEIMQDSIIQMSVMYEVTSEKNEEISIEKIKKKNRTVLLSSVLVIFIIGSVFIYYRKQLKQKAAYEKKLADEQKDRFKEVFSAIENERKRIAVDLHDSLGQMLSTTKLYLSGLEDLVDKQEEKDQKVYSDTWDLLDESCKELRNISYNIMPGTLIKYGLNSAVEEIINKINNSNKIKMIFEFSGLDKRLSESAEIITYRIIQEILNNIIKHSAASNANVNLLHQNSEFYISIEDNGKGMEDFNKYKNKGMGWKSIFSRVEMLNGTIEVNTNPNRGTRIDIIVPV